MKIFAVIVLKKIQEGDMKRCKECGGKMKEFFEWKFEYGFSKKKISQCECCGNTRELGMFDL